VKNSMRIALAAAVSLAVVSVPAFGFHRWSTYHWKKGNDGLVKPPVVTAITATWTSYVATAVADWNKSTVIDSPGPSVAAGVNAKTCRAQAGRIVVCNARYGQNGWLGIASIWLSSGHIVQGTTKLNDTYFALPQYNTASWRAAVTCQEIGHDYGLGHQDENFSTDATTSCMEYTANPAGNEHPDAHDYDELMTIYNHTDATDFGMVIMGQSPARPPAFEDVGVPGDGPAEWGQAVHRDAQGRPDVFVREFANGGRKVTHVLWAIGEGPQGEAGHQH
jgi:hypothetical protein